MLKNKLRILDGGLASTLGQMGHLIDGDPLWSARCLYSNPDSILKVHSAFLAAGADILITASYQASIPGFTKHLGISRKEAQKLIERSVYVASEARNCFTENSGKDILVAGSVGPFGACKADGSEYTGSYISQLSKQELMDWHQPRLEALISSGVDLIAMETFPALGEALALLKLLKRYPGVKTWITFSCKDGNSTNFGDDFGTTVKACFAENPDQLVGIGINCTHPSFITPLLMNAEAAVPGSSLPRVVYPNSGEIWTSEKRWEGNPDSFLDVVKSELNTWLNLGTRVIGGCCRVTPSYINALSELINTRS